MTPLPDPPALGMLAGSVGKGLVFAAIAAFATSALLWILDKKRPGGIAFTVGATLVLAVFGVHAALLLCQQYEYKYVFDNTQKDMPTVYRFSAAWAAQEGSFLLWTLTSALVAAIA
ncbi:MAG: hypothetical protein H0W86_02655, partial [Armatimonadetes bacterium]|nr:hypothetical protein [Armatimonadota bacterium]